MTQETLTLLIIYFGLSTVIGGLALSYRFTALHRDAMIGAFAGFGAGLVGLGVPGIAAAWTMSKPRAGVVEETDVRHQKGGQIKSNVVWGMGAFGIMWVALAYLAANTEPSRFLVVVAGGLYEGMLIFLVAAGLSIIFGLMDVLNFAQGSLFMIGAYCAVNVFREVRGDSDAMLYPAYFAALIAAFVLGGGVGALMEYFLIRPTYSRPLFQMVLTFGVALVIHEIIVALYGTQGIAQMNLKQMDGGNSLFTGLVSGTRIQAYWVVMIVIGVLMMIGVQYILQNTRIGIIIRAGVQDSEMVEALGINVRLIFTGVFALGAAIASLGGAVASGFLTPTPAMGDIFLLQAIAAVIVGGMGSYSGTAIASLVMGILGAVASHFALVDLNSEALGFSVVLMLLLAVLYVRPTGLFGT